MNGTFYGVSVGPGDPELLTLKAVRIIKSCPVIAAPRTKSENMFALSVAEQVVDMTVKTVIPLDFPMKYDRVEQHNNHRRIAEMLPENGTVYAVENCGLPDQRLYHDIDETTDCGYLTVVIVK